MEDNEEAQKAAAKWRACRRSLHPVFVLVAVVCLLALVGWIGEITELAALVHGRDGHRLLDGADRGVSGAAGTSGMSGGG